VIDGVCVSGERGEGTEVDIVRQALNALVMFKGLLERG
jgi:hypothetical protein